MAKEHPKKDLARMLYIEHGFDAKTISEMTGISQNSIGAWVNSHEDWKKQRQVRMLSPDKLVVSYYKQSEVIVQIAETEKRGLTTGESDSLLKLAAAIQKLDKKVDPSITMSVFRNFNNWLMQIEPLLAKQIAEHQLMYIQTMLKDGK